LWAKHWRRGGVSRAVTGWRFEQRTMKLRVPGAVERAYAKRPRNLPNLRTRDRITAHDPDPAAGMRRHPKDVSDLSWPSYGSGECGMSDGFAVVADVGLAAVSRPRFAGREHAWPAG
jgi:hypothetical protein